MSTLNAMHVCSLVGLAFVLTLATPPIAAAQNPRADSAAPRPRGWPAV